MPAISATRPRGGLDRGQDRAGAGPVAARHRHRRVVAGRDQSGAAVERQLRGQQLVVVEAAVPGDDDDAAPRAPPRPPAPSAPASATISCSVGAPITKAPPPAAASPARRATTMPAVTIRSGPTSTPSPRSRSAYSAGRRVGLLVTKHDLLAGRQQRRQRLGRAGDRLAADPDDAVEVDQEVRRIGRRASPAAGYSLPARYGAPSGRQRTGRRRHRRHPPLRRGRRRGRRAGRRQHRLRPRPLHRDHGTLGLGQVDADAHPRRPRQADQRHASSSTGSRSPASTTTR